MKTVKTSLLIFTVMTLLLGVAYPLAMTALARIAFPVASGGSLVTAGGRIAGSELIGQRFTSPRYFHGRPSAAHCDASSSRASNLGPTNRRLIAGAAKEADIIRRENGLPAGASVPADLVLASGSGLDPHISLESALFQSARVARERGLSRADVESLVMRHVERRYFGLAGDTFVNVLTMNIALDTPSGGK